MRSFRSVRSSARTSDIGLRRLPQPPMPMVMPSSSEATASSSVISLLANYFPFSVLVSPLLPAVLPSTTKSSRRSSETPDRFSSNVKPCSKR